jgi:rhomboid family GlyGly-CTERM serine protease
MVDPNIAEEELEKKINMQRLGELFVFVAIVFLLQLNEVVIDALRYDRALIASGELWRLLTGNLVHLSSNHMLMNISVFVLASMLFRHNASAKVWYGALLTLGASVGIGLYLWDTEVSRYVGLSGILYGLFAFGLLISIKDNPLFYIGALIFVVYKVLAQQGDGYNPEEVRAFIGGNVIESAHLYGLIVGLMAGFFHVVVTRSWQDVRLMRR